MMQIGCRFGKIGGHRKMARGRDATNIPTPLTDNLGPSKEAANGYDSSTPSTLSNIDRSVFSRRAR